MRVEGECGRGLCVKVMEAELKGWICLGRCELGAKYSIVIFTQNELYWYKRYSPVIYCLETPNQNYLLLSHFSGKYYEDQCIFLYAADIGGKPADNLCSFGSIFFLNPLYKRQKVIFTVHILKSEYTVICCYNSKKSEFGSSWRQRISTLA